MNQQDQQAIDELFRHLDQQAAQAGPRDSDAEALIQQHMQQGSPGLLYQMAQTLVAQQHTLNQLRSRLAGYQRQGGAPAGFGAPQGAGGYQAYGQPQYQPPGYQHRYQQPATSSRDELAAASWPARASSRSGSAAAFSVPRC